MWTSTSTLSPLTAMHASKASECSWSTQPTCACCMLSGGSGSMNHGGPGGNKRSLPSSGLGASKRQNLNIFAPHGTLSAGLDSTCLQVLRACLFNTTQMPSQLSAAQQAVALHELTGTPPLHACRFPRRCSGARSGQPISPDVCFPPGRLAAGACQCRS